jgi:nucleotide-binding universal stress UspA family protein
MEDKNLKILVPINGSLLSLVAEETAVKIAKKTKAIITLLYITPSIPLKAAETDYSSSSNKISRSLELEAEKIIKEALVLFNEEGIKVDTKTLQDNDPAAKILEFSENNFDIIIIGAHRKNEKNLNILDDITKKVLTYTQCPTFIIKKVCLFNNFLVCIDGSENSIKALKYALTLAKKMNSTITLFNVQPIDLVRKSALKQGEKILSKALDTIGKNELKVENRIEFGSPSERIVEFAEKGNYDLIIMGSRGLGVVKRLLLGSVSDDVSYKSKSSVLIIPSKK